MNSPTDDAERDFPRWVARHPVGWGLVTASLLLSIALLLDFDWWFAVLGACAFGAVNWWIWRGNGPAHRWRAALIRRFSRE